MARAALLALAAAAASVHAARFRSDEELVAVYGPPVPLPKPTYLTAPWLDTTQSLRQAAVRRGIFVGAAINPNLWNASDPQYAATFAREYNLATAENSCKFAQTEPSPGAFNTTECDAIAGFTLTNASGAFRGHNFAWGVDNPPWLANGNLSAAELDAALSRHIGGLLSHYTSNSSSPAAPGPFLCWDVVNEAVDDGDGFLKNNTYYPTLPDYVQRAFSYAAAGGSSAQLFYNDYSADEFGSAKQVKVQKLAQQLLDAGVPLAGIGLQLHISIYGYPDPAKVAQTVAAYGAMGLAVHFTELDVRCPPPCNASQLETQASVYGALLSACLSHPACRSFETWGFTDRWTWLDTFDNPNRTHYHPLPFDQDYAPKPAYFELLSVLQRP